MAVPPDPLWEIEPHTLAKHTILREYLKAWYPICAQSDFGQFTYAEGFAGPGIYTGGEPGSPIIALNVFLNQAHLLRPAQRLNIRLIEEDPRRVTRLKKEILKTVDQRGKLPPQFDLSIHQAMCAETLVPMLRQVSQRREPFFAVLDGWGSPEAIPFDLARGVAGRKGGEVLVTFQTRYLIRFGEREAPRSAGDRSFGSTRWREVIHQPSEQKKTFLVNAYRDSLKDAGFRFVASFEMLDEKSNDLHLVFATNHIRGLEKMKQAMWKVDRSRGYRFRDPRDPEQMALFLDDQPELAPLRRAILHRLKRGPARVEDLRRFALTETVYREQDASSVVKKLYQNQQIASSTGRSPTKDTVVYLIEPGMEQEPLQETIF